MVKKSLLIMMLLALFAPWAANAQTVTIGTGTGTQNMSPMANYYDLSFTEMIYTAEEIAAGNPTEDNILSVGFQLASNGLNNKTYSIAVYMKNYDADEFGTATFVSFASTDAVFTGTVTATTSGWVTIDLDSPFAYDNTKNLLIGVNKTAGGYAGTSYDWNYTSTSKYQHLYKQQDGTNVFDPANPPTYPTRTYNRPNVQLTFGVPPTCFQPQNLQATLTPGNGTIATLTWERHANGTENAWVLQYGEDNTFATCTQETVSTNPTKDLSGLTAEQTYYARVKPDCDTDGTKWSDVCEFKPTYSLYKTVYDGTTTNSYIPVYGYWCDAAQRSEFIIPSTALTDISGATINSMKFYANYNYSGNGTFQVYVREVNESSFSNTTYYTADGATTVYTGKLTISLLSRPPMV